MNACNLFLCLWWAAVAVICLLALSIAGHGTVFELTGTSEGNGSHVMELSFTGDNLTREDGILLLAYRGYSVQMNGTVWLNNESWNVTGAI